MGEVDFLVIPAVPWEGFVPICMVAQPSVISFTWTHMSQDVSTTAGCSKASWGNVSHIRFVKMQLPFPFPIAEFVQKS